MNLLAVNGSPRKGKSTDVLIDTAIEGVVSEIPDCQVKKIHLIEHDIQFCRNCLACRDSETTEPVAKCSIRDGMDPIREDLLQSDLLIFGTPVHMGYVTGVMMTFLERVCWTFAKPEKKIFTVYGCPLPRSQKTRKGIIIVTSSIVPPLYRKFCDWATKQIECIFRDSLNAKVVGDLYAGDIENRGVERYYEKAFRLGKKLA